MAEQLSTVACIRIANKSATMLFSFCRQWEWDETHHFLQGEGYTSQGLNTSSGIMGTLRSIIIKNDWPTNTSRSLPLLYMLGKAKSLLKQCILCRPIAAAVEPQMQRFFLCSAACALTLLLRLLVQEITASFLVLRISDLQPWVHGLAQWDCSGQFNNITPQSVISDLQESVKWLAKKATVELVWSIH